MKYDYDVSSHRKKRFIKRASIIVVTALLLISAVVIAIRVDSYLQESRNTPESSTSQQTTGYFAPTTQIFRSPYFQFQTNKTWAEVGAESTDSKFVYRSLRINLVEHELTIYVNDIPATLAATRVLPVSFKPGVSELLPKVISGHCNETRGGDTVAADEVVTLGKVSMLCDFDNTRYEVLVGAVEGSTKLNMRRPDKSAINYTIFYRNVTAKPEPAQLLEIINSFQTR